MKKETYFISKETYYTAKETCYIPELRLDKEQMALGLLKLAPTLARRHVGALQLLRPRHLPSSKCVSGASVQVEQSA